MKQDKCTRATEDYIKVIYDLTEFYGRASTNQISEALGVKPASVTGMIQKLASATPPLVEYQKHRGVKLTPEGERAALQVTRQHRLLEQFLFEVLGFSWEEVHEEAHRLEHVISEKFVSRMAELLKNPRFDPHGDPIPTKALKVPSTATICLCDLQAGQRGVFRRILDDDPELLRYLWKLGILPEIGFTVLENLPIDDNIKIQVTGQLDPVVLGEKIYKQIYVDIQSI